MAFDIIEHPSQSPAALEDQRDACLAAGAVDPKFHYESPAQVEAWLQVHETHSPARTDPGTRDVYDAATDWLLTRQPVPAHLLSLGSGGAQKDARLLRRLADASGQPARYTAVDVGRAMVLASLECVHTQVPEARLRGIVADVTRVEDPVTLFAPPPPRLPSVALMFGLLPNFTPAVSLRLLTALTRDEALCLVSANLAPGADYAAATARLLPQYDNPATRRWLCLFPTSHGVPVNPDALRFSVEPCPEGTGLLRIEASVDTPRGALRLFHSYRHTPDRFAQLLDTVDLATRCAWVSPSGEEGVFAVSAKTGSRPDPSR